MQGDSLSLSSFHFKVLPEMSKYNWIKRSIQQFQSNRYDRWEKVYRISQVGEILLFLLWK